jgi:hypothetical protein
MSFNNASYMVRLFKSHAPFFGFLENFVLNLIREFLPRLVTLNRVEVAQQEVNARALQLLALVQHCHLVDAADIFGVDRVTDDGLNNFQ